MVEGKKKRGRPKKNPNGYIPPGIQSAAAERAMAKEPPVARDFDQRHRRDDLCIQMIMGIINKQGQIKYDFAKDIFDTATQLAYDFGWMTKPKPTKKKSEDDEVFALLNPHIKDGDVEEKQPEALANTPADIFRMLREG